MKNSIPWLPLALLALAACSPAQLAATPSPTAVPTSLPTATFTPAPAASDTPVPTALSSQTPEPAFGPGTQVPAAGPVPAQVIDLYFVDPLHGWIAGLSGAGPAQPSLAMASSADGGSTWQALPLPPAAQTLTPGVKGGVFFLDQKTGWIFFHGLFSTLDGGLTWTGEHPAGQIVQMGRSAGSAPWALEKTAAGYLLWKSAAKPYAQWEKWITNFPVDMAGASLSLADAQNGWVLRQVESAAGIDSKLYATHDGGKSWEELVSPCTPYNTESGQVVAVDVRHLWLGCGQAAGAGSGSKFVFTSADGGQSWDLKGKGALPPTAGNTLSTGGYFNGIHALNASFAYFTAQRALTITLTRDGGSSWEEIKLPCSVESTQAFFVDPLHGWAYDQACINRTTDGGKTWVCAQLPQNEACPAQ